MSRNPETLHLGGLPSLGEQPDFRITTGVWDSYEPRGMYRLHVFQSIGHRVIASENWMSLEAAMLRFNDVALPVQYDFHAWIVDSRLMMVFGYVTDQLMVRDFGDYGLWMGCAKGFEVARGLEVMHPLQLALCEELSKRGAAE